MTGPTEDLVREISTRRGEPSWLTDWRIAALRTWEKMKEPHHEKCSVVFELYDYRKALERVLLHFAHFEKEVVKESEKKYRVTVVYEKEDETELVIRILSFGPMIKVMEPDNFVNLIKQRLTDQMSCGL